MPRKPAPKPRRRKPGMLLLGALAGAALLGWGAFSLTGDSFRGAAALEHAERLTAFGPRPPGTDAHREMQRYIVAELEKAGVAVEENPFTASTPYGPVAMNNIVGRIPGRTGRIIVLASHYDTKRMDAMRFVGANDGGSSTGLLLALAPVLAKRENQHDIWLVFLDGEEAFEEWTATDSLYGSRHLAQQWRQAGILSKIGAFLLVDLIGDADLDIRRESQSTPWLTDLVWKVARGLGYSRHFLDASVSVSDDHVPFLEAGVPAVDLIDFNYGPDNSYWHTAEDTLDKLSAGSLEIVGKVLLGVIAELEQ